MGAQISGSLVATGGAGAAQPPEQTADRIYIETLCENPLTSSLLYTVKASVMTCTASVTLWKARVLACIIRV